MELTHGSLFSGIGGFDLGFERAGFRSTWRVKIPPSSPAALAKHSPGAPRHNDIRSVGARNLEPVDVITGGFPCQPFSVAGKRAGAADDRYLWPEMLRVIAEVQPAWVVAENVPGLINMGLDQVLSDLEASGYETGTLIIPACGVDAPHRRNRLWIVAHTSRIQQGRQEQRTERERAGQCGESGNVSDASSIRCLETRARQFIESGETLANASQQPKRESADKANAVTVGREARHESLNSGRHDADANSQPSGRITEPRKEHCEWLPEPGVGRVAHGISNRVDRLKALGNAIVPQIAEFIAWRIREAMTPPSLCGEKG